jgi:hypothetical protein
VQTLQRGERELSVTLQNFLTSRSPLAAAARGTPKCGLSVLNPLTAKTEVRDLQAGVFELCAMPPTTTGGHADGGGASDAAAPAHTKPVDQSANAGVSACFPIPPRPLIQPPRGMSRGQGRTMQVLTQYFVLSPPQKGNIGGKGFDKVRSPPSGTERPGIQPLICPPPLS